MASCSARGRDRLRDSWLLSLKFLIGDAPLRRVPPNIPDDRLLGGLDLAATLAAGRPVAERGLLAAAHGGVILLAMAERLPAGTAARIGATIDHHRISIERDGFALEAPARFGAVALDEGEEGEAAPVALTDRLAIYLTLDTLTAMPDVDLDAARALLAQGEDEPAIIEALCGAAMALGIASLRAPILALRVARAAAALGGRVRIGQDDAALAARLVLAPRATRIPESQPDEAPPPEPPTENQDATSAPPDEAETDAPPPDQTQAMQDMILAAASAVLPANLLARLGAQMASRARQGAAGKSGAQRMAKAAGPHHRRPRRRAARRRPHRGAGHAAHGRTLAAPARCAAGTYCRKARGFPHPALPPTQRNHDDLRRRCLGLRRAQPPRGSQGRRRTAARRLLCAARPRGADHLPRHPGEPRPAAHPQPHTRARRALSGLPGGGGTPLATAMDEAMALAEAERRAGRTPVIVILTDGRANIARDGAAGRPKAEADALDAARPLRAAGIATLLVDTAPRPQEFCRRLAEASGARLVPLPQANSTALNRAVQAALT